MSFIHAILGSILKPIIKFLSKRRLPQISGRLHLKELHLEVTVTRDNNGRPYISAKCDHDLYLAQAFVHAQDRLWQMELNRRVARGRLAEVFGKDALDTDRAVRVFGFERIGMIDWEKISEPMKRHIEAYLKGLNAYLSHPKTKLPIEFTLAGFKPDQYVIEDVLAFSRFMMWQLSHAWQGELVRMKVREILGEELFKDWDVRYPDNAIVLPDGIDFQQLDGDGILKRVSGPYLSKGKGSNSIVIAGEHTQSGKPIMANDMHLELSTPSLWYEISLENAAVSRVVRGASLPGLPMVLVGSNQHFAWGATLAYTDAADLYIEKINWDRKIFEFQEKEHPLKIIHEQIHVKGEDVHEEEIYLTTHGPLISQVVDTSNHAVSVKDLALAPTLALDGWRMLNEGESWDDFVDAVKQIQAPQLNLVYMDDKDNIGYWCTGQIPVRQEGHSGKYPVPGWTGDYEWKDMIPFEEMPHALNPESGYIITANNRIIDEDYSHFLGDVWMNGYRAQRIENLLHQVLDTGEKIKAEDVNSWFLDIYCIPAVALRDLIEKDLTNDEFMGSLSDVEREALEAFLHWDGKMQIESVAASMYELCRYFITLELLESRLPEQNIHGLLGVGFHPILLPANEFFGHETPNLLRILENPESHWFETHGGRENLVHKAFQRSFLWLKQNVSGSTIDWQWGKLHQARFPHAFDIQPPMDRVFNPKAHPIPGNTDTPYQTAYYADNPFENNAWSISYRILVDGQQFQKTQAISSLGQSGHLGSKHYADLTTDWLLGMYHPYYSEQELKEQNEGELTLTPES